MKEKNLQPRLLYPAGISFKYEGEIKSFTDKQKLRELSTTKLALQQILSLVGFYHVPLSAEYFSAFSSCLGCCVWGGLSVCWKFVIPLYCGGSSLWVGLDEWLLGVGQMVSWLGKLESVF